MKAVETIAKSKTYEFGEYRLEAESLSLLRENKVVQLPPKTVEVLLALVESGGRVVSREEINERVWAGIFVEEANLTHHVSALRKIFNETGGQFIETVPRRGYRFTADVREAAAGNGVAEITVSQRETTRFIEEEIEIAAAPPPIEESDAQSAALETSAKRSRKIWRRLILGGTIAALALAVVGYGLYKYTSRAPARFEAKKTTRLTSSGRVKVAAIAPDGKFVIYSQEEMDGRQSLWVRHIGSESAAQLAAPAAIEYHGLNIAPDGNSFYYVAGEGALFQMPILGGAAKKITDGISKLPYNTNIAVSPDSRRIAFVRRLENQGNTIFTADADGTNEQRLFTSERVRSSLAWSPDGETIAVRVILDNGQNILAVRVADGTSQPVIQPTGWNVLIKAVWLPDSKNLAAIGWREDSFAQHIFQIGYPNGETRQVIEDRNNYFDVSATADGRFLAAVRTDLVMHIWTMPSDDATRARQLTDGFEKYDAFYGLGWLSADKIVYSSLTGVEASTWAVETSGGNVPAKLVRPGGFFMTASPDGRYVIYQKNTVQKAEMGLYRTDLNDGTEKQLTSGADIWAIVSPDGRWVIYNHGGKDSERSGLWKVPIDGGEPSLVYEGSAICPAISPDGKTVAFVLRKRKEPNRIALVSSDGGETIKTFDAKLESYPLSDRQNLQWTTDGSGIYFVSLNDGVSNIWRQPVDGSPPVQVTDFKDGRIFNFAFSADGLQLALSRGTFNSDVVLIESIK